MANYGRGYYSANAQVKEGYYRGPYRSGPLANFKNAIATVINLASTSKSYNGVRNAVATAISLASPSRLATFTKQAFG